MTNEKTIEFGQLPNEAQRLVFRSVLRKASIDRYVYGIASGDGDASGFDLDRARMCCEALNVSPLPKSSEEFQELLEATFYQDYDDALTLGIVVTELSGALVDSETAFADAIRSMKTGRKNVPANLRTKD